MARDTDRERLELLQGTLDMLILRTLQWGPQHGHGIGQAIRTQSDGLLKVETGSLYPALHRLEKREWLKSEWDVSEANQRAKFYRPTAKADAMRFGTRRGSPGDDDLDAEIRGHLALSIRERIEGGEDPRAARLAALKEF